jgi:hypothetical protein
MSFEVPANNFAGEKALSDRSKARCAADAKTRPAGSDNLRRGRSASPRTVCATRFDFALQNRFPLLMDFTKKGESQFAIFPSFV